MAGRKSRLEALEGMLTALGAGQADGNGSLDRLLDIVLAGDRPLAARADMFMNVVLGQLDDPAQLQRLLARLLERAQAGGSADLAKYKELYEKLMADLEQGPTRPATLISCLDDSPTRFAGTPPAGSTEVQRPRLHVITPDGQERYPFLLREKVNADELKAGMTVLLDEKGGMVTGMSRRLPAAGQVAAFVQRILGQPQVEVEVQGERFILHASEAVLGACEAGGLEHGARLLIGPRREFAFSVLPAERDRRHRFVDSSKVPDVDIERDIGRPHWVLGWLLKRTRLLLFRPELLERHDLRPFISVLMTGPSGTGKTLTIRGFLADFYRLLRERTGRVDIESRTIRVASTTVLSEWLGRSDRNAAELFDDILSLVAEPIETAAGERVILPVVVVIEEAEGLLRKRGEHDGTHYDRILTTFLQRLDDPHEPLRNHPVILLSSSNRGDLIDSAALRRLGAIKAHFPHLDRRAFTAVLSKKLKPQYAYAAVNGASPAAARQTALDQVVSWLFSPNADNSPVLELTLGDGARLLKQRREFLTGSIVDQAVSNAIDRLVFAALDAEGDAPENGAVEFTAATLVDSLREQIDSIADLITAHNVRDYLDLPEHVRVDRVRRLRALEGQAAALLA